jgi:hypothetical protein
VACTGLSTDFTKPFISQWKINGGGPIPGVGNQAATPSFSSLAFNPKKVCGSLCIKTHILMELSTFISTLPRFVLAFD